MRENQNLKKELNERPLESIPRRENSNNNQSDYVKDLED